MKSVLILSFLFTVSWAQASVHWGRKVSVGEGYARTYIRQDKSGPKEIGIALSRGALKGLSHEMEEFVLPLPTGAHVRPYRHVTLDWNPHGHEPETIYTKPHFDMHFYFVSNGFRQKITCVGEDEIPCLKQPSTDSIPSQYAPTPAGVPKMGWHWVDLLAPEFNGGIFTRTFIYGYYQGKMIFAEPMVTLEYLQSRQTSLKEVRRPERYPYQGGYFPYQYKVSYDQELKLHKISLSL